MLLRLLLVAAMAIAVLAVARGYSRRRAIPVDVAGLPPLDATFRTGDATWVVFTTEYCATCGPVKERIARLDPTADIVEIDVASRPDMAHEYRVRTAPTVLFASANGRIQARFVGNVPETELASAVN